MSKPYIDPIETLLDETLAKLRAFDPLEREWFAETLLDGLGYVHGVGAHDDPIENVRDVGEGFITTVALATRQRPERVGDTHRAVHQVLVGLLEEVQLSQVEGARGQDAQEAVVDAVQR